MRSAEILERINALPKQRVRLMEVCGTHTMAIAKAGIKRLLPPGVELVSGPGCPVCVTPPELMDAALELAVSARYETDSTRLVIPKECFPPEFFWLSTGLAGEILQKWTNYQFQVAIFGDFSAYAEASKSLRDFIYECNRGTAVFFVPTRQEAEERLSQV